MDHVLDSLSALDEFVQSLGEIALEGVAWRGVHDISYQLIPKVGRRGAITFDEDVLLEDFKDQAKMKLEVTPNSDWEWLALAQHHGLPTRLLDWSTNPLVACFFAVKDEHDGDSLVYAYRNRISISQSYLTSPFEVEHVVRYIPGHVTKRIAAQSGLFTVHPDPTEPFESQAISKLLIPNWYRKTLKRTLCLYGVNYATLFPDLDGLSKHMEWLLSEEK